MMFVSLISNMRSFPEEGTDKSLIPHMSLMNIMSFPLRGPITFMEVVENLAESEICCTVSSNVPGKFTYTYKSYCANAT